MIEVIVFGLLTAAMSGYLVYDNQRLDRHAKSNATKLRESALEEIDSAGLSVTDFPKYEDALRGERHLKVNEIIDIYYVCKSRRRR